MARLPRFVLPNYPQHVIQRGNNRSIIFNNHSDYIFYLEKLCLASLKSNCWIHSYVLMTNHVHLLVTPLQENSISKMQQILGRYYVQYFNKTYGRTGTLWEGRYKATLIENETYFLTCMRYIELNPVRAGMVADPGDYPWSSYHYNASGKHDTLITSHEQYISLAATTEQRLKAYKSLFTEAIPQKSIDIIREATNGAWVIGDELFKKDIQPKLNRRVAAFIKGGDRRSSQYKENTKIN